MLEREDENTKIVIIPTDPLNRDYAEFLSSNATAANYVEPPELPEPTLTEKLAAAGIDLDELKTLLAA